MEPIEIMCKEYETLREEILTAMGSRNSILAFGLATIGAIFTASIATYTTGKYFLLASLMLLMLVPAICNFVLFIWLGEYQRMQRAGKFLVELETRINSEIFREILTWETNLRGKSKHMKYPYTTTVMMLTIISLISMIIGLVTIELPIISKFLILVSGLMIHTAIYRHISSMMAKLRI